jgi:hypothetical protein
MCPRSLKTATLEGSGAAVTPPLLKSGPSMHHFKIIPAENNNVTFEVFGSDRGALLTFLSRVQVSDADIWEAGKYLFSAKITPASQGLWVIYEKPDLVSLCHAAALSCAPGSEALA